MWEVGDWMPKSVCFIYGNGSRPIWFHWYDKASLFISCLISADNAISLNISELQAVNLRLQVGYSSSVTVQWGEKDSMALTAFDHDGWEINYAHATHQLFLLSLQPVVLKDFQVPSRKKESHSKQCCDAGFHQPGPCMSAVTQWQGQTPICQNHHSPYTANFFHLSNETIFHSWHLCWLSI